MFRFTILHLFWCLAFSFVQAEQNETEAYLHAEQRGGQFWLVGHDSKTKEKLDAFDHGPGQTNYYYISPDRHWLFTTTGYRHRGLEERELFAVGSGTELTPFNKEGWFSEAVEKYALKNGVLKKTDIFDEQKYNHLQTDCLGWSIDSSRLLVRVSSAQSSKERYFYVYFNTRTKAFEETSYLRAYNNFIADQHLTPGDTPSDVLCTEPISSLPAATELVHRLETLDSDLNTIYQAKIDKSDQANKAYLRDAERDWIDARDEGLKFYLKHVPESERERRRLQFLGDATAQQILVLTPPDSEDEG